jgi:hypothetical protein
MDGDTARELVARVLLEKVRDDPYPSQTHMNMLEQTMPRELVPEYLEILVERVSEDRFPSIPMLQRIQRVAASL